MRTQTRLNLLALVSTLTSWSSLTLGADCDCDHEVSPDQLTIDGDDLDVKPGDTVCIQGGERAFLRISNMEGTEDDPILIQNCEGQVVIDNSDRGYGLTLESSKHVRLTGNGDDAHKYGFKVRASRNESDYSASCIIAGDRSTNFEIDHIEAYGCGFAGLTTKTDPTCDEQDMSDFVQRNTRLHHLYLHDTRGEGIYFGNTGYPSRTGNCDGKEVDLIPHTHEGVWIHDNIIEDTGWDGAQIGVSPKDCYFYRNRIARVGLEGVEYQMQGFQIGGGSSCDVTDNFISSGPAIGIIVLDASDTLVANNVVEGFETGIYFNDRETPVTKGAHYHVIHNTVINTQDRGIAIFGSFSTENAFINNLIVDGGESPLSISGEVDAESEGNLVLDSLSDADFIDPSKENYQLDEDSPAVDAGVDASTWGITTDQRGAERDDKPDAGAFEFGAPEPDEPNSPPGPGDNPSSSDNEKEGGCSMSGGSKGKAPGWIFGTLLALAFIRRPSSRTATYTTRLPRTGA